MSTETTPPSAARQRKPLGYWQVWANLAQELTAFILEHGEPGLMPSKTTLTRAGRSDLINAIWIFGGQEVVAERLGLLTSQHPAGYWHEFGRVEETVRSFIATHGEPGIMPDTKVFRTAGRSDLLRVIQLYHGGLARVARRLGLTYMTESQGYWQAFEHVAEALFVFMETHELSGVIPTHRLLRAQGASTLSQAILSHGGSQYVAEQLGLAYNEKSPGHWQVWATFAQALETFMAEQGQAGVLPTQTQLRQAGRTDLVAAIRLHGGMKAVAERGGWRRARSKPRQIGGGSGA